MDKINTHEAIDHDRRRFLGCWLQLQLQQLPVLPPTWGPHPDSPMETPHRSMELKIPDGYRDWHSVTCWRGRSTAGPFL
jgi:hypothetical protein